jgi:glycerol-3-phosphate cytidylyltransferase/FAD synthetase
MYVCQINERNLTDSLKGGNILSKDQINEKIDDLIEKNLVNKDRITLTEIGRNSLCVVLAGGVFDIIHPGNIHTLKAAKALGDILVVAIATDKTAQKMKKRIPLHNQELRRELVDCLSMVDVAIIGHENDIFETVKLVKPEIIALGYDQIHQEKFISDGCKRINLNTKIVRLQSPVPEVSSSDIQKEYGKNIYSL